MDHLEPEIVKLRLCFMHTESIHTWQPDHGVASDQVAHSERRTRWVVLLAVATMAVELAVGSATHSLALLADGWHMASHVGALGLSLLAYWYARRHQHARAFSFGTGKVYALAGYTSAVALGIVALLMLWESGQRLITPVTVSYDAALTVAVIGLGANLISAWLLEHDEGSDDHNARAAYLHVVADALTSLLAIGALASGKWLGWTQLDATAGLLGGAVILWWSAGLLRGSSRQLLDLALEPGTLAGIHSRLEAIDDARVADLHLWQLGPGKLACIASLVTATPRETSVYREAILSVRAIDHVTVEVHRCPSHIN